jgi:integral membrane protein
MRFAGCIIASIVMPYSAPMENKPDLTLQLFYIVGFAEAVSSFLLFFIAMPLKYWADMPQAVSVVGMIHGILFLAYIATGLHQTLRHGWPWKWFGAIVIGSIIPMGPFVVDYQIKKRYGLTGKYAL